MCIAERNLDRIDPVFRADQLSHRSKHSHVMPFQGKERLWSTRNRLEEKNGREQQETALRKQTVKISKKLHRKKKRSWWARNCPEQRSIRNRLAPKKKDSLPWDITRVRLSPEHRRVPYDSCRMRPERKKHPAKQTSQQSSSKAYHSKNRPARNISQQSSSKAYQLKTIQLSISLQNHPCKHTT